MFVIEKAIEVTVMNNKGTDNFTRPERNGQCFATILVTLSTVDMIPAKDVPNAHKLSFIFLINVNKL